LKLLVKEIIIPRQSNNLLFVMGPCITLIFALLGWAIIPFGEGLAIFDYELGIFFALAVSSLGSYGILISGWAANSKYAFMGAIRSTAQLLSYELVFSSIILILILFSGSFSLTYIVECQQTIWNLFPLLPIALMFFIAILAETNRPPFDLPEARFGLLNQKNYYLFWFNIKFIIYWKLFLFYLYFEEYWKINTISKNKININNIYLVLQRLYVNYNNLYSIFNVKLIILSYIYCLLKLKSCLLLNKINNVLDLSILVNSNFNKDKIIKPEKIYNNIENKVTIEKIKKELKGLKGIYGFFCKANQKIYIGSSENLVSRFKEHIKGKKSNIRLQKSIKLYGLSNFYYIVFESYMINQEISLIDLETKYISYVKSLCLYNLKSTATSMLGYKHTLEARQKMVNRFKNSAHPMLGKNHSEEARLKIKLATRGCRNPMYGRKHKNITKELISFALSKPVYIYKLIEGKYILSDVYKNSVEVARKLGLHKTTIGRYIKKKKLLCGKRKSIF